MKTKLMVDMKKGYGKAVVGNRLYTVLRAENLWNLSVESINGSFFNYWAKENVKRLSTLQKFADNHDYQIEIVAMA